MERSFVVIVPYAMAIAVLRMSLVPKRQMAIRNVVERAPFITTMVIVVFARKRVLQPVGMLI